MVKKEEKTNIILSGKVLRRMEKQGKTIGDLIELTKDPKKYIEENK